MDIRGWGDRVLPSSWTTVQKVGNPLRRLPAQDRLPYD
ncbi:hypothetical protein EZS27_036010, partial [termite gut metagenome]